MAGYVQIIEFKTARINEVLALLQEELGSTTPRWGVVAADRDRPDYYVSLAEFESITEAMWHILPEAAGAGFSTKMAELCDEPPRVVDLDVVKAWQTDEVPEEDADER